MIIDSLEYDNSIVDFNYDNMECLLYYWKLIEIDQMCDDKYDI